MEPEVIYTDNHLLIVNKPMGMVTQPDLEDWGKEWMLRPYAHAVHRLDRAASGIVVVAKTSKALSRLNESMRAGLFKKTYRVILEGVLKEKEGRLEDFLVHDEFRARIVTNGGRKAILTYKLLRILDTKVQMSMIEVSLLTGRYHQIRVQFASRGHPILGDTKYESHYDFSPLGIALHHQILSFPHPITGEKLIFEAPFPAIWSHFI